MSNMSDNNEEAFDRLINQYESLTGNSVSRDIRYIYSGKKNSLEKSWLKYASIEDKGRIDATLGSFEITYENDPYIGFYGVDFSDVESNLDSSLMEPIEINSGVFTLILAKTKITIDPGSDLESLSNELFSQHKDPKYKGHEYSDILKFIEPISFYKVPPDSAFFPINSYQIACYLISQVSREITLSYTDQTLEMYREICLEIEKGIDYENIYTSITSSNFKHSYLELYRCIEKLYAIPSLKELHEDINTSDSLLEFISKVQNSFDWRPNDSNAIEKIFSSLGEDLVQKFTAFISQTDSLGDMKPETFFYKLRNSIVHFRIGQDGFNFDSEEWSKIISIQLELVKDQYSTHKDIFKV